VSDTDYVIGHIGETPAGNVVYELVRPDLQRMAVTIRRKHATGDNIDAVIRHAIANVYRPTKPL